MSIFMRNIQSLCGGFWVELDTMFREPLYSQVSIVSLVHTVSKMRDLRVVYALKTTDGISYCDSLLEQEDLGTSRRASTAALLV